MTLSKANVTIDLSLLQSRTIEGSAGPQSTFRKHPFELISPEDDVQSQSSTSDPPKATPATKFNTDSFRRHEDAQPASNTASKRPPKRTITRPVTKSNSAPKPSSRKHGKYC